MSVLLSTLGRWHDHRGDAERRAGSAAWRKKMPISRTWNLPIISVSKGSLFGAETASPRSCYPFQKDKSLSHCPFHEDKCARHAVSHPVALRWMVRQLLGNAGGLFSVQKFYDNLRSQGVAAAKDTLHAYLAYLEDAFLVRILPIATDSERRRQVNPRKAYPIDPGLIPVFDRSGKANVGHALETAVLLELERRGFETA